MDRAATGPGRPSSATPSRPGTGDLLLVGRGGQRQDLGARRALCALGHRGRAGRGGDPHHHLHREGGGGDARPHPRALSRARRGARGGRAPRRAFIATIHGFCARVLRAHALVAGLDPAFTVLDELEARRLAGAAFDAALEELLAGGGGSGRVRGRLRPAGPAGGHHGRPRRAALPRPARPALPALAPAPALDAPVGTSSARPRRPRPPSWRAVDEPGVRVIQALRAPGPLAEVARRARSRGRGTSTLCACPGATAPPCPPGLLRLHRGARAACARSSAHRRAARAHRLLDRLLRAFGVHYRERKRARSAPRLRGSRAAHPRRCCCATPTCASGCATRFARIMVDELQDTNQVQLELIARVAHGNLFTVGDAQQSIYGFRHADVELFERLAGRAPAVGRSRHPAGQLPLPAGDPRRAQRDLRAGAGRALRAAGGRAGEDAAPAGDPRVELLLVDKGADWQADGLAAPWRQAEARALAARVRELIAAGTPGPRHRRAHPGHDRSAPLRARARGPRRCRPTSSAGAATGATRRCSTSWPICGRWPTRATKRPCSRCSPRRSSAPRSTRWSWWPPPRARRVCDPWTVLREPVQSASRVSSGADRERLRAFTAWFARRARARRPYGDRGLSSSAALERTGYDVQVLALPGGRRRLANVRKLMRLAREHEAPTGPSCAASSRSVAERAGGGGARRPRERGAGRGGGARRGPPHDHPPVQGPRVRRRLRGRSRTGALDLGRAAAHRPRRPARAAAGRAGQRASASRRSTTGRSARSARARGRRGAPALLRGHDAGPGAARAQRGGEARQLAGGQRRRARGLDRARPSCPTSPRGSKAERAWRRRVWRCGSSGPTETRRRSVSDVPPGAVSDVPPGAVATYRRARRATYRRMGRRRSLGLAPRPRAPCPSRPPRGRQPTPRPRANLSHPRAFDPHLGLSPRRRLHAQLLRARRIPPLRLPLLLERGLASPAARSRRGFPSRAAQPTRAIQPDGPPSRGRPPGRGRRAGPPATPRRTVHDPGRPDRRRARRARPRPPRAARLPPPAVAFARGDGRDRPRPGRAHPRRGRVGRPGGSHRRLRRQRALRPARARHPAPARAALRLPADRRGADDRRARCRRSRARRRARRRLQERPAGRRRPGRARRSRVRRPAAHLRAGGAARPVRPGSRSPTSFSSALASLCWPRLPPASCLRCGRSSTGSPAASCRASSPSPPRRTGRCARAARPRAACARGRWRSPGASVPISCSETAWGETRRPPARSRGAPRPWPGRPASPCRPGTLGGPMRLRGYSLRVTTTLISAA